MGDEGWSGGGSDEDGEVIAPSKKHGGLNLWEKSKPRTPEQRKVGGTRTVMDSKREKKKKI